VYHGVPDAAASRETSALDPAAEFVSQADLGTTTETTALISLRNGLEVRSPEIAVRLAVERHQGDSGIESPRHGVILNCSPRGLGGVARRAG
jgi:hypothetical protein